MATADGSRPRSKQRNSKGKLGRQAEPKVSRTRKPADLSLEDWQIRLRRQFGREQPFQLKNIGEQPIFSEFRITNPQSKSAYRVAIRGTLPGENYCGCPDFATNALGTCKHIEFALARLASRAGGKKALSEGYQPPFSEVYLRYGSAREVCFRAGEECSPELARLATKYFDEQGKLLPDAFGQFDVFLSRTSGYESELRVYEDALQFIAELRDRERREQIIDAAFPRGIRSPALKNLLQVELYDYQRQGVLFAAKAGRSLIGDEMGLGKTVQAVGAAEVMARHLGVERVLIVTPTSLKHQWEREISRFTGRTAQVIGGNQQDRTAQFAADAFFKITNYDTVHRDLDLIAAWSPDLVILDEAQRIKNWETRTARAIKKIASPYAIVLTGTPLENRLEELVSIVQFVDQHRLGPTFRFLDEHQVKDEQTGRVVGYQRLDEVGKTLEPILLRRKKDEVLKQLPQRLEKNFFVPMTSQQMELHEQNREMVAKVVHKWRRYGFLSESDQRRLMIGLQNMRMSCNSTYLLDATTDFGLKADELATLLEEVYEHPDTKVVIFSQWVRTHELLKRRFKVRDWQHVFFHGGVESSKRKGLIDTFREDHRCRAFLSTDAGGVGLNLQHASVVVNMDLPWNPAVLEQRIGRVHRLGQTRPVQVVNFVAQGTIEEGMLSLLGFKKSLFAGILDGGEKEVFLGGTRLKRFLETVEKVTTSIPEAAVEERLPPRQDISVTPPADSRQPGEPATIADDPLSGLVRSGLALLEQLAAAPASSDVATPGKLPLEVHREGGRPYLKIQLPEPEVVDRALDGLRMLLTRLRG